MTTETPDTAPDTAPDAARNAATAVQPTPPEVAPKRPRRHRVIAAVAAPLALGAAGLSLALPSDPVAAPLAPVAIAALQPSGAVAAKGEIVEIFGNKFVLQDASGRALVETGRAGQEGRLVAKGETVTIQGRFENGFLHARTLTRADGTVLALGPAGGPRKGGLDRAKDRVGLAGPADLPALTGAVERAGYTEIRVTGRGRRHLDVAAKGRDGRERLLHVGFDGDIREKAVF